MNMKPVVNGIVAVMTFLAVQALWADARVKIDGSNCRQTGSPVSGAGDRLITYPDYPDRIERDDVYRVTVTQGSETKPLVVWNHCEKSILQGRTHGGDVNRRFCEFAFAGAPVRVDIRVSEDVKSYALFPSRLHLKSAFGDGVVSVWLDRPEYFGLRLNDSDKSILTVLADPPEIDPPKKGAPGVLYVEGWVDATGTNGVLLVQSPVREVYIAPGSVLNARLYVAAKGCRVRGRGMILDPMSDIFRFDQSANREFGTFRVMASDVVVEDVKLVDARTFNWIFISDRTRVRNTKTFSSMMCSDGMSFWGGRDVVVDRCWVYSGDNGLVVSGTQPLLVKDTTVGTSCAAIFPQSSFKVPSVLENVSVFRSDEGLVNNYWNGLEPVGKRPAQTIDVRFRNFSAIDTVQFAWIFQGHNMGYRPKTLVFDNASFPEPSGVSHYNAIGQKGKAIKLRNFKGALPTGNYHLFFTNLFVGGEAVASAGLPPERIENAATNQIVFATRPFAGEVPLVADRHEVGWTCPADRRRRRRAAPEANLVAETKRAHSVWQRCPSYQTRLEARREADGSPVYVLSRTRPGAGMQAILTDEVLAAGNGAYRLSFEARATPAKDRKGPVPIKPILLSNEKSFGATARIGTDWSSFSFSLKADFAEPPTDLVSLFLSFPEGTSRAEIRKVSFEKDADSPANGGVSRIGAVNWDCSRPSSTYFGFHATKSLGPERFRDRTPYYAKVIGKDKVDYADRTVEEYSVEMQYAIDAGIDYFAYCWYDRTPPSGSIVTNEAAQADGHISELTTARQLHEKSPLRNRLNLCAILVVCHPYSDAELRALAAAMTKPYYEKLGTRPLVYLFMGKVAEPLARLRRFCREAGAGDPYAVLMRTAPTLPKDDDLSGLQALGSYTGFGVVKTFAELVDQTMGWNAGRASLGFPTIPVFTTGWDPTPRVVNPVPWSTYAKGPYAPPATEADLLSEAKRMREWVAARPQACPTGHVLASAWNEFEEGCWICPTWRPDGKPDFSRRDAFARAVREMKRP